MKLALIALGALFLCTYVTKVTSMTNKEFYELVEPVASG